MPPTTTTTAATAATAATAGVSAATPVASEELPSWGWFVSTDLAPLEVPFPPYPSALPSGLDGKTACGSTSHHASSPRAVESSTGGSLSAPAGAEVDVWLSMLDDEDLGVPPVTHASPHAPATPPSASTTLPLDTVSRTSLVMASGPFASIVALVPSSLSVLLGLLVSPLWSSPIRGAVQTKAQSSLDTMPEFQSTLWSGLRMLPFMWIFFPTAHPRAKVD